MATAQSQQPRRADGVYTEPDVVDEETPRRWSRRAKLMMLAPALVPLVGLVVLVAVHVSDYQADLSLLAYGGHVVVLMSFLSFLFYIRLLMGNQRIGALRYFWAVVFLLIPFVSLPVYWWQYVWLDPPPDRYDHNRPGPGAPADRGPRRPEGCAPG